MTEWKEVELQQIADVQTGPFGSQLKNEQYITGGTPVVTVEHLKDFRIIDFNYPSVTDEDKNRLSKYLLKQGDIVFSRVGSVDLSAFVKKHQDGWMFSSRMLRVRTNAFEVDSRFLSYYFQQKNFRDYILNISVGATMPSINTEILKAIPFSYPSLPEQKSIASILSSLDDKIDLLHRQNATLEKMAETLFRQWFVEEAKEDWETKKIKEVCLVITKGTTPTTLGKQFKETGINFVKAESLTDSGGFILSKFAYIDSETDELLKRSRIQKGDILITIAGTIGRIAYATEDILPANTNQAIGIMRVNNEIATPYFIYCLFKTSEVKDDFDGRVVHAVQPNLSLGEIGNIEFKLPPKEILDSGMDRIKPLFLMKEKNQTQIRTLTALRDTLLPKLMSGEIKINL